MNIKEYISTSVYKKRHQRMDKSSPGMVIYDITFNIKLPPESHWLNPKYSGEGDNLLNTLLESRGKSKKESEFQNPLNWKKDFPDYVYQFDEFQQVKTDLNNAKRKLDKIYQDSREIKLYGTITDLTRIHDELRTKNGRLVKEYGAEIATNAWMKMYELCLLMDSIFKKYSKSKPFNSFHIAEAPGTFMLAINHYLQNHYPRIEWKWLANSFRDLFSRSSQRDVELQNTHYLVDDYGLIKKYYQNWLFGADGDGDITSPSNIKSFQIEIEKRFGTLQFITSDVKYVPRDINFDEEEAYNVPVHMGHLLAALFCLDKGGSMILKEFTFFESQSICLLMLANFCFENA